MALGPDWYNFQMPKHRYYTFSNGASVLLCGVSAGKHEIVDMLLSAGANINQKGTFKQKTPLHMAAELADTKMVQLLLQYNAKPSLMDEFGKFYV